MTEPTPITTAEPVHEPEAEMTMDEAIALYDVFCAALREVGHDLKAAQQEEQAA